MLKALFLGLTMLLAASGTMAEAPLRVVVPFAPGGGGDRMARLLAPGLARELGTPVIVENRPGANGIVGMQYVRNTPGDMRVVVLASDHATVVAPLAWGAADYDVLRDFAMVAYVARFPYVLAVPRTSGIDSPGALQASARRQPVSVAVPAEDGLPHAIARVLSRGGDSRITVVPFSGGSPAAMALVSGQVTAGAIGLPSVVNLHREGKVRILAVTGGRRSALLPDVPTFGDTGMAGLAASSGWSLLAPKGSRVEVDALNRALRRVLGSSDVQDRLRALGLEPLQLTVRDSTIELRKAAAAWTKCFTGKTRDEDCIEGGNTQ
ncbi:MAG TPA: tripartite tricarboxylate transporter substrate binding protein [Ramlibacter sp.]|jgi:tripartite-type tricarboxylate transporter receptor subunit TctC|nr:tripartite tricarboxylate transporter substrate binding protein [Ramlibacter sp.]